MTPYVIIDDFESYEEGGEPTNWTRNATSSDAYVKVVKNEYISDSNNSEKILEIHKPLASGSKVSASISKTFEEQKGIVEIGFKFYKNSNLRSILKISNGFGTEIERLTISESGNRLYINDRATELTTYKPNQWYDVKLIIHMDTDNPTTNVYLNETPLATKDGVTDIPLWKQSEWVKTKSIGKIEFTQWDDRGEGSDYFDDIYFYNHNTALQLDKESILSNVDLNAVTENLTLPTTGKYGSTIVWETTNPDIISETGEVTRPEFEEGNAHVQLTATLTKEIGYGGLVKTITDQKVFNITVVKKDPVGPIADELAVKADKEYLEKNFGYNFVDSNMTLPLIGAYGSDISWQSENESWISIDGDKATVTRPSWTIGDQKVKLTATITKGSAQEQIEFIVTVLKLSPTTDAEIVQADSLWLDQWIADNKSILTNITSLVYFPNEGNNGAVIEWKSGDPSIIDDAGNVVYRPTAKQGDKEVIFTANITKGSASLQKKVRIVVKCLSSGKAFPGAMGFGANTRGGAGGKVVHVTNLNPSGPGSLKYAVEEMEGPRIIVFDVGGTIDLSTVGNINFRDEKGSNITIAGQTAPGNGIQLKGYGISLSNVENVIIRHIRIRIGNVQAPGNTYQADPIRASGVKNVVLDHVSTAWSIDASIGLEGDNVTISNCLFADMLTYNTPHEKGSHNYVGMIDGNNITYYSNFASGSEQRSIRAGGGVSNNIDIRNNVLYNCNHGFDVCNYEVREGYNKFNVVGNFVKPGPQSKNFPASRVFKGREYSSGIMFYAENNLDLGNMTNDDAKDYSKRLQFFRFTGGISTYELPDGPFNLKDYEEDRTNEKYATVVNYPFPGPAILTRTPQEAYQYVLENAGATKPKRDSLDQSYIEEAITGTGSWGYGPEKGVVWKDEIWTDIVPYAERDPKFDTDRDGMADEWERENGLIVGIDDSRGDIFGEGYTNIEYYINNYLAGDVEVPVNELMQRPTAIENIGASKINFRSAEINFNTYNATTSKIYFGTSLDNLKPMIVENELSTYHTIFIKDLQPLTKYYYKIECTDEFGNTVSSDYYDFTTTALPTQKPGTPVITKTINFDEQVRIKWTRDSLAEKYVIRYGTQSGVYNREIEVSPDVYEYTINGLENYKTYYIAVFAVNRVGETEKPNEQECIPTPYLIKDDYNQPAEIVQEIINNKWEVYDLGGEVVPGQDEDGLRYLRMRDLAHEHTFNSGYKLSTFLSGKATTEFTLRISGDEPDAMGTWGWLKFVWTEYLQDDNGELYYPYRTNDVIDLTWEKGKFKVNGEEIQGYKYGQWYKYKIVSDSVARTFDVYVNDKLVVKNKAYNYQEEYKGVLYRLYTRARNPGIITADYLNLSVRNGVDAEETEPVPVYRDDTRTGGGTGGGGSGGGGTGGTGSSSSPESKEDTSAVVVTPADGSVQTDDSSVIVSGHFDDLSTVEWAKESINYLYENGIVVGRGERRFEPEGNITRAEFIKMLVSAFDLLDETAKAEFSDVSEQDWFYKYVASAYALGLVSGYPDGSFGADQYITRQDMAVMAYRVAYLKNPNMFDQVTDSEVFLDYDQIADYALEAIQKMKGLGIINGIEANHFGPHDTANRAQAAKIIYELISRMNAEN